LLQAVSALLQNCVRETDTVARLGGDEFVIVLPNLQNPDDAGVIAAKILHCLRKSIELDGNQLFATPSIGIALYPDDGQNVEALMQSADTAMYHAKESGRNNFQFFTSSMNKTAQDRVALEQQLRLALERGEIELHYQPKIALDPFRVVGCEALVRWNHPQQGYISPDKFIPIAEETGLILPLGEWIMSEVARQNRGWVDAGLTGIHIAINFSPSQFRDKELSVKLCKLLDEAELKPESLEIEITESLLMDSISHSRQHLERVSELGISLAIDDFGTGYSSLAYLNNFSVNTLKIDKSFLRDITVNLNNAAIVRAVISLAHELGLIVVAEGVETEEQRDFLAQANCDVLQGFLFSKALPAIQFQEFVFQSTCH
jgi:EAL domain-containing protein (putative c-di-GMP-specific phosphodiesterase class I)